MKKLLALLLTLALALTVCACGAKTEEPAEAPAEETAETAEGADSQTEETPEGQPPVMVIGTLSLLNMTEAERLAQEEGKVVAVQYLKEQGAYRSGTDAASMPQPGGIVFFDTLEDMVAALEAGDISSAEVPESTAAWLCAHNDKLMTRGVYDLESADDFTKQVAYRLGAGFSFLTAEDRTELRDALDQTLTAMKEDGTLDALIQTYIIDGAAGDPEAVELPKTDGETVKVAVTGVLPPMDYVSADGTPAGFSTALLAELGKRMNVNFEPVLVDCAGRADALASGQVDLVFWSNGSDGRSKGARQTVEEHAAYINELSDSQRELMHEIAAGVDYEKAQVKDAPAGTVATQPYFSDLLIPLALK